jgi:hypothetical protein
MPPAAERTDRPQLEDCVVACLVSIDQPPWMASHAQHGALASPTSTVRQQTASCLLTPRPTPQQDIPGTQEAHAIPTTSVCVGTAPPQPRDASCQARQQSDAASQADAGAAAADRAAAAQSAGRAAADAAAGLGAFLACVAPRMLEQLSAGPAAVAVGAAAGGPGSWQRWAGHNSDVSCFLHNRIHAARLVQSTVWHGFHACQQPV